MKNLTRQEMWWALMVFASVAALLGFTINDMVVKRAPDGFWEWVGTIVGAPIFLAIFGAMAAGAGWVLGCIVHWATTRNGGVRRVGVVVVAVMGMTLLWQGIRGFSGEIRDTHAELVRARMIVARGVTQAVTPIVSIDPYSGSASASQRDPNDVARQTKESFRKADAEPLYRDGIVSWAWWASGFGGVALIGLAAFWRIPDRR